MFNARKSAFNRKKKQKYHYSISRKLRSLNKSSDEFEVMVGNISLEDLIALKLEISSRILNHNMYCFNFFSGMKHVVKSAVIKYALSATRTMTDAADFLGTSRYLLIKDVNKYHIQAQLTSEEKTKAHLDARDKMLDALAWKEVRKDVEEEKFGYTGVNKEQDHVTLFNDILKELVGEKDAKRITDDSQKIINEDEDLNDFD